MTTDQRPDTTAHPAFGQRSPDPNDPALGAVRGFLEEVQPQSLNPAKLIVRALRGRKLFAAFASAVPAVGLAALVFSSIKPVYESEALIRAVARQPDIVYADKDDSNLRIFDSFVTAEASYLTSKVVLGRAIALLAAQPRLSVPLPANAEALRKSVAVERNKALISVRAKSRDAQAAARIVNAVVDSYLALHAEQFAKHQKARQRELSDREARFKERFEKIDREIVLVGAELGSSGLSKSYSRKVEQIEDLEKRIAEIEGSIAQIETKKQGKDGDVGDAAASRAILLDRTMADMAFERTKRAAALESLLKRYQPNHPEVRKGEDAVKALDDAIAARRRQIATLATTGLLTGDSKSAERPVEELKALLAKLGDRRNELRRDARDLNERMAKLGALQEERTQVRTLLDETRQAIDRNLIEARNSRPGHVELIAAGLPAGNPAESKGKTFAMVGGLFGGLLGVGGLLSWTFVRRRFRFSDELGDALPRNPLVGVLPGEGDSDIGFAHRIRTELQLLPRGARRPAMIAVASELSLPETARIAASLARANAETGVRTLLVDGNLAAGTLTSSAELRGQPGLREALRSGVIDACVHTTGDRGLAVMPCGADATFTDLHLSQYEWAQLAQGLKRAFDLIVIDAGSTAGIGARLLAAQSDQTVVVVPAGTGAAGTLHTVRSLDRVASGGCSLILTGARPGDPGLAWFKSRPRRFAGPVRSFVRRLSLNSAKRKPQ